MPVLPERIVSLSVGEASPPGVPFNYVAGFQVQGPRIDFTVTRLGSAAKATAIIQVHNMGANLVETAKNKYKYVILSYKLSGNDDPPAVLFAGELRDIFRQRQRGVENITTLVCGDGLRASAEATMHVTFPPFTDPKNVVNEFFAQMRGFGVERGFVDDALVSERISVFTRGLTLTGQIPDLIREFLRGTGLRYDEVNGVGRITSSDKGAPVYEPVLITPETGLIESITRVDRGYEFKCLINSAILPNQVVGVASDFVDDKRTRREYDETNNRQYAKNAVYVNPDSVVHKGTSWSGPSTTIVEGVEVAKPK